MKELLLKVKIAIVRARLFLYAWDESKHPRDAEGQWTAVDESAMEKYIKEGSTFRRINAGLRRGGNPKGTKELNAMLEKLPTHKGVVYRGLKFENVDARDTFIAGIVRDGMLVDKGFVSTSTTNAMVGSGQFRGFYDRGITLVINSRSGRRLPVSNKLESEVLFKTNTRFKLDRVKREDDYEVTTSSSRKFKNVTLFLSEVGGL